MTTEDPRTEGFGAICWMAFAVSLVIGLTAFFAGGWPAVVAVTLLLGLAAIIIGER